MKQRLTNGLALAALALSLWNCKTSDPTPSPYESGVLILNAGNFSQNNGTISFLNRNSNTVATDIFQAANMTKTSGLIQGYTEVNGKGLILVDNSAAGQDRVEIVDYNTFTSRASLKSPDIENPRQVIQVGPNKAYVSCWDVSGDFNNGTFYKDPGYIAVVDLNSNTVTKKIPAVKGVENMVVVGTEVFVGSNAYSGNNTLLVIDLNTDTVKESLTTLFTSAPEPIALDGNNLLWVRSGKDMVQMDPSPSSRKIVKRLTFASAPASVVLAPDKQTFYYTLGGRTYTFLTSAGATSNATGSQVLPRSFSALGIDPATNVLYASVIPSYAQAGYVLRYRQGGALIDSVKAEIAPSGFYFR